MTLMMSSTMAKKKKSKKELGWFDLFSHYLEKILSVAMALFVLIALGYAFFNIFYRWL